MNKVIKNGQHFTKALPPTSHSRPEQMIFHDYDKALFCDVDETLVFVKFPDSRLSQAIDFSSFGYPIKLLPHWKHVELIKHFRSRGIGVFVWSAGGAKWANAAVQALGLKDHVHVLPKPTWLLDDKSPGLWLSGARFYLDIDTGEEIKDLSSDSFNPFKGELNEAAQTR